MSTTATATATATVNKIRNLKIRPDHIAYMKEHILACPNRPSKSYYLENGFSETRWRWDSLWNAKISRWITDNIYPYANDAHIDSALKYILQEIETGEKK